MPIPLGISLPDMGMSMVDAGSLTIDKNLFTAFNSYAVSNKRTPGEIGITERSRISFVISELKTCPALLVKHGKPVYSFSGKLPAYSSPIARCDFSVGTLPEQK